MTRAKGQRIKGRSLKEIRASTEAALKSEVFRLLRKPLEQCSKEELASAWPDGFDVEATDEDTARYVAQVGLELGIPMYDPTLEISETFDSEELRHPTLQFERTRFNLYVLRDGKRIACRGQPETPQAGTWVSMVKGVHVIDIDEGTIEVVEDKRH